MAYYECECDNFDMTEGQDAFEMNEGIPGPGVPAGGSAGQVLRKTTSADYDTEWDTLTAGDVAFNKESGYVSGTVGRYLQLLDSEDVQYTYGGEKELGTVGETLDYLADKSVEIGEDVDDLKNTLSHNNNVELIAQKGIFNFNVALDQLEFTSSIVNVKFGGYSLNGDDFATSFRAQFPISMSAISFGFIYINNQTGAITFDSATNHNVDGDVLIGAFFKSQNYYHLSLPFRVNGSTVVGYNTNVTSMAIAERDDYIHFMDVVGKAEINILAGREWISGYYNTSNGYTVTQNANFKTTFGFVPVIGGATYARNWSGGNVYEYDKDMAYIGITSGSGDGNTVTLSANAAFARFTCNASIANPVIVLGSTATQVDIGLSRTKLTYGIFNSFFNFNTTDDQLEYTGSIVNLNFSGNCLNGDAFATAFRANFPFDMSNLSFGFIYINTRTGVLNISSDTNFQNDYEVLIGAFYKALNYYVLSYPYTVDGKQPVGFNKYINADTLNALEGNVLPFDGGILSALGDSITEQAYSFWHQLDDLCGFATLDVDGIGGSCIAEGDTYESKIPMVDRYSALNANADVIYIMGGTNDWGHNITFGQMGDTAKTTFYGALNTLCVGLVEKYPLKKIFFITPLQRNCNLWPANGQSLGSLVNGQGKTLLEYVNAIKEVCSKYAIPVLDFYNKSGITGNIDSVASTFYNDGLHPTQATHNVLAKIVANYINNVL